MIASWTRSRSKSLPDLTSGQCAELGGKMVEGNCIVSSTPEVEASLDFLKELRDTGQVYIIGHDTVLSISKLLFKMLDTRRRIEALKRRVPENQFEFEDAIGALLGITP